MFKKLSSEDFAALRGPFESGRQSPKHLGDMLFLSVFLQGLMYALEYFVTADDSIYPNKDKILTTHFWITLILIIYSIIYSIPAIYKRSQKMQYLVVILVSQNLFGVIFYIMSLFTLGSQKYSIHFTKDTLLNFTYITLLIGFLIFIVTFIRFYILLIKGHYRKGSKKAEQRENMEYLIKSYLPVIISGSVGLLFVMQFLFRNLNIGFNAEDIQNLIIIILGIGLFFTMMFVLPEQLVLLYCKYRFEGFNFYLSGDLKELEG
jgi:MFS family permease